MGAMDMEILSLRLGFAGHGIFSPFDRFTGHWTGPNEPFVIGLAFQVGWCRRFRPVDAVVDREPNEPRATADAIERSPPETTHGFGHRDGDPPDDLAWLQPLKRALRRLAESAPRFEPVVLFRFHRGGNSDLKCAISGLRHGSSRRAKGAEAT
jgi:hypothetical protein